MTGIHSGRAGQRRLVADLQNILVPAKRPNLAVIAWRWRYELALAGAIAGAVTTLLHVLGAEWGTMALSALAAALVPPWPPSLAARAWCVITPHRLRAGFSQAHIRTAGGRLPAITRTTPAPFGERVRIWCPAGISAEDLRSARALLRASCWAADVRITTDEHHAHLLTVDVIRRPAAHPLSPGCPRARQAA